MRDERRFEIAIEANVHPHLVEFEITEGTRQLLLLWVQSPAMLGSEHFWPGRFHDRPHISPLQYGRMLKV